MYPVTSQSVQELARKSRYPTTAISFSIYTISLTNQFLDALSISRSDSMILTFHILKMLNDRDVVVM